MEEKKIAFISDIHSNLEALNAVIEDAGRESVTDFYCLGDVVGYNANPQECVNIIRDLCAVTVCGNHDYYSSHAISLDDFQPHAAAVVDWTRRQLNRNSLDWLQFLPFEKTFFKDAFSIVHSTLDTPEMWGYVFDTIDAESHFAYQKTTVCFHGHTHIPLIFEKKGEDVKRYPSIAPNNRIQLEFGRKYFINVGSVGQPRDEIPDASYLIFEPRNKIVQFRRVPYDIETAADKVRKAGLPPKLADRLFIGK